ncbi:hypothetical protein, partial [Serratia marcescens]|uniref:hypothetical protein n=1 Tax=Serratia marcescens TaxID=615 RepID=UPI0019545B85
ARDDLIGLAINAAASPFRELQANTLVVANGRIASPRQGGPDLAIADLMARLGRDKVEALRDTLAENHTAEHRRYDNFTTVATMRAPT